MEEQMKSLLFGLVLILFGIGLIPVVFGAVENANWTLATGVYNANATLSTYVAYNLSWVGYIVGLCFTLSLIGFGIAILMKSFK